MDTQKPEDQAAKRYLHQGHDDVALDRRADDGSKFGKEIVLLLAPQWKGIDYSPGEVVAVAQKEK